MQIFKIVVICSEQNTLIANGYREMHRIGASDSAGLFGDDDVVTGLSQESNEHSRHNVIVAIEPHENSRLIRSRSSGDNGFGVPCRL